MPDNWWVILLFAGEWLFRLLMVSVVLLRRNARSATSITWIAIILAVPLLGAALFLTFGMTRLGSRRIRRYRAIVARVEHPDNHAPHNPAAIPRQMTRDDRHLAQLAESLGAAATVGGNALHLMGKTDEVINRMIRDIDAAQHHCHLLFYIYLADATGERLAQRLIAAAQRGVHCRLLVDGLGSRSFLRSELCRSLRRGGVHVTEAMPVNPLRLLLSRIDLRNHRKIVVIDGTTGYTGSQNIANADFAPKARYAPWVDAMVRIEGPAVRELQVLFVEDWFLDTNESLEALVRTAAPTCTSGVPVQVYATGPTKPGETMRTHVQAAIQMAREELVLTTPYFVPDEALVSALATGARRGTRVTLIVPKRNDSLLVALASRAFYGSLLEAGVHIMEFRNGLLHAKTLTIDRHIAMITSANIDRRSFDINFEAGIVVYDSDFASELRFLQGHYMDQSDPVRPATWVHRPMLTRMAQNGAAMLGPLL